MPCIHVRTRCYGKIQSSMEDIHSKLSIFCPLCKRETPIAEWAGTAPFSSLVHFSDITVTEGNKEIIDWIIQWSKQEV